MEENPLTHGHDTALVGMAPFENEGVTSWREEKKRLDDWKGEKKSNKKTKIVVDFLRDQSQPSTVLHRDPSQPQPPAATIVPCVHPRRGSDFRMLLFVVTDNRESLNFDLDKTELPGADSLAIISA